MSFRWRLLGLFAMTVVAAVVGVEWVVSDRTRQAFERVEMQRVDALVAQFRREFARRGQEIVRAVNGIAASDTALNIAIASNQPAPDFSPYVNEAAAQAATHGLDLLEFLANDGAIISSAQWPARFGYRESWIVERMGWKDRGAFLRREELPGGVTLALIAVATASAGERTIYVAGGQQLDREFVSSLVLPAGMRVLLYRNLERRFTPQSLIGATGPVEQPARLASLIEEVRQRNREWSGVVDWPGDAAAAETFHAIPLRGTADDLLGVLLIGSSRRELVELERSLRWTSLLAAGGGVVLAIALTWWAAARVTRPVLVLAERAREVAAGNWNARVDVESGDEIGALATAFNRMTQELVKQRERLVQAERVAAWRELARRLAHELKNPLFPLQITVENMQRARERHPDQFDEVFREGTATLLAELSTLRQIIGRFSDFAKMPRPELQPVDLNEMVTATMKLVKPQLETAHITERTELDPWLRPIEGDPAQLRGVLRNLVLNAIDAMPSGGILTVRTSQPDGVVRLEVADTGQGLTPEECERLFTPYYTTKTHGTGLGLAIVQSVVSDHHGRISVESAPGKGSTFRIDLG